MKNKKTPIAFRRLEIFVGYQFVPAERSDVPDVYDKIGLVGQSLLFRLLDDYYDYKNGIKLGRCASDPKIHSNYKNRILAARQQVKEDTIAGIRLIEGMTNLLERRKQKEKTI
jgi:hypothetical protein